MDLRNILEQLGPWIWVIGGLVLLGLEILAPRAFFLWFGISAIIVGAVSVLFEIAWQAQVVAFGVLAAGPAGVPSALFQPAQGHRLRCLAQRPRRAAGRHLLCPVAADRERVGPESGSATPTGLLPAPICRRARGSGSCNRRRHDPPGGSRSRPATLGRRRGPSANAELTSGVSDAAKVRLPRERARA